MIPEISWALKMVNQYHGLCVLFGYLIIWFVSEGQCYVTKHHVLKIAIHTSQ